MSGWTYEVARRKVKTKTQRSLVRAFSEEEAITQAKWADNWGDTEHTASVSWEYEAVEVHP